LILSSSLSIAEISYDYGLFFQLNELKKRRKAFPEWVLTATTHASVYFLSQLGNFLLWAIIMMFFVHIVVSNPKLLHIVKDVVVMKLFPSIRLVIHPWMASYREENPGINE
jgi:hypothetical protein